MNPALLGFALGWLGSMPLAGPVSVMVARRGLAGRVRCGLALAIGAALAETGWCAAALYGCESFLDRWSWLRPAAGAVGGAVMIGLGLKLLLGRPLLRDDAAGVDAPNRSLWRELAVGFSLVFFNVSVLLSWLGILVVLRNLHLDSALTPDSAVQSPRIAFLAAVPLGIVSWFALLLWLTGHTGVRVREVWLQRLVRCLGLILLAAGLWALVMVGLRLRP